METVEDSTVELIEAYASSRKSLARMEELSDSLDAVIEDNEIVMEVLQRHLTAAKEHLAAAKDDKAREFAQASLDGTLQQIDEVRRQREQWDAQRAALIELKKRCLAAFPLN